MWRPLPGLLSWLAGGWLADEGGLLILPGGSWVARKWSYKSPNIGYNYSYPAYNLTYKHP